MKNLIITKNNVPIAFQGLDATLCIYARAWALSLITHHFLGTKPDITSIDQKHLTHITNKTVEQILADPLDTAMKLEQWANEMALGIPHEEIAS